MTLLASNIKMRGSSYTRLANLKNRGSAGGSSNSFGPYLAKRDARAGVDSPFLGSVAKSLNVSWDQRLRASGSMLRPTSIDL